MHVGMQMLKKLPSVCMLSIMWACPALTAYTPAMWSSSPTKARFTSKNMHYVYCMQTYAHMSELTGLLGYKSNELSNFATCGTTMKILETHK